LGDIILMHDATEREVPRPVCWESQEETYSGKKKRHTIKNAVVATTACIVIFLGATVTGNVHDKPLADEQYSGALAKAGDIIRLFQDTGYQGFAPEGVKITQPQKKPRGKDLSGEQKEVNKGISKVRVRVEHVIGGIKRYKIVREKCRLRKNSFPYEIIKNCTALYNFRVERNPVHYPEITI
jgi:hypothetical protein